MDGSSYGVEREATVREIASRLGVADFVFNCAPVAKGKASREIGGDGLLIVGDLGAILQVKTRDREAGATDQPARAASWISKNIAAAESQGAGTRREILRRLTQRDDITVLPARVMELPKDRQSSYALSLTDQAGDWPTIVVIEHDQATGVSYAVGPDTFVITLVDWLELHRRIRSTYGVLRYVRRVLTDRILVPLGHEVDRYVALYNADAATNDGSASWTTELPVPDAVSGLGAAVYKQILDRVWPDDGVLPWNDAHEYRQIVEFLDRIPAHVQEEAGDKVVEYLRKLAETGTTHSGGLLLNRSRYLQIVCRTTDGGMDMEHHMADTSVLTIARHLEIRESGGPNELQTLGVGILNDDELGTAYSFTFVDGDPDMPDDIREACEQQYGRFDYRRQVVVEV